MKGVKPTYRILRFVLLTVIAIPVILYVGLYVALSLPSVQEKILDRACAEVSKALGGNLKAESLTIRPFSEVILKKVSLDSPTHERVALIDEVAAGIDMRELVRNRRIVINYAQLIGLDARISQMEKDGPLNIQFMIDALAPKDRNKPPTEFDLRIRDVVIRDSKARFQRPWLSASSGNPDSTSGLSVASLGDIRISGLRLDLSIPVLKNDDFVFDVRNMQCVVNPGLDLRRLTAKVEYKKGNAQTGHDSLRVEGLEVELPNTTLSIGDIELELGKDFPIEAQVRGHVTPSDICGLVPGLERFDTPWDIEIDATKGKDMVDVRSLVIKNAELNSSVELEGSAYNVMSKKDSLDIEVTKFKTTLSRRLISESLRMIPGISGKTLGMASVLGDVSADIVGTLDMANTKASAKGKITTGAGRVGLEAKVSDFKSKSPHVNAEVEASDIALGAILKSEDFGRASFSLSADVTGKDMNASGYADLHVDHIDVRGYRLTDLTAFLEKDGKDVSLSVDSEDDAMLFMADASVVLDGKDSRLDASVDISRFSLDAFGIKGKLAGCVLSTSIDTSLTGEKMDDLTGFVSLSYLKMTNEDGSFLSLPHLTMRSDVKDTAAGDGVPASRSVTLRSDWLDATAEGIIAPGQLGNELLPMISRVLPSLIPYSDKFRPQEERTNDFSFDIVLKGVSEPYDFFNTPVRPLSDIPVSGRIDTKKGTATLTMNTQHIQQGKDKLIRDTSVSASIDSEKGEGFISLGTIYPAKKGDVQLVVDINAKDDRLATAVDLNPDMESALKGNVLLSASFSRSPDLFNPGGDLGVRVGIQPSTIAMSGKEWDIAYGTIEYKGKRVSVSNLLVQHANQFVRINGVASERPEDKITVALNDIDLEYIFGTLNINYVTFGGMATGEVTGCQLLSKRPEARTKFLHVRGLSYNGAVLGDGDLASEYDVDQQKVGIYAVIRDPFTKERRASIDGGIWVTRDSLSFAFDANKVNLQLMKPFVAAFCPDLRGQGSGRCKLYGTFSDIDLVGDLYADTIAMKIDFTNSWYYAGGDSVHMGKGRIDVPPLTLYDRNGHTAELSGWLTHRYFHEPAFDFRVRNARSILCYDTNERLNPDWYGTIYGTGNGQITGEPGLVSITMDMTTERNSSFTFVISDAEDVEEYSFLTFTDRRKEEIQKEIPDTTPLYLKKFLKRKQQEEEEGSSDVVLSLRGTVTPDALVTLVMDPKGGDRITARGSGALQMDYASENNDFRMFGKYVLDEGNYNFTLQDIIIKNFIIRQGSSISFNGDPMDASLNIAATYRVNTNLTDLDKSFATDRELNRTNVPIDALLQVTGPMTQPDITFDIELPTLTQDVERKVKSIVSTNDMMSRQIIYLLALNRFYTPEYTGGQSNGSEWSSMASSTLSSQLSNILSQMTDKLSVAPSFRSDKGDFSDMEFDLALSSRLLNNRLLVNGNFGYRDKTTSTTQFIGDFDLEYLLNRSGNLRLKAYNHFNDQNYYLRSALTTQGVGVIYRRDFDRLFRRKKNDGQKEDSVNFFNKDSVLFTKPELIKVEK